MSILKVDTLQPATGARVLSAGHVVQVINANCGPTSTTSTSFVDTGLTATITPSSTSSKVLVIATLSNVEHSTASKGVGARLEQNGVSQSEWTKYINYVTAYNTSFPSINLLCSPSSTSAVVYKIVFKSSTSGGTAYIGANASVSTMTLMEIAQ